MLNINDEDKFRNAPSKESYEIEFVDDNAGKNPVDRTIGPYKFLPHTPRCCVFISNLRYASLLIVCWSMLAASHEIKLVMKPVCGTQYQGSWVTWPLIPLAWILFFLNLCVFVSAFLFLLLLVLCHSWSLKIVDIFVGIGFAIAVITFIYCIVLLIRLIIDDCRFDDFIYFLIHGFTWLYFIMVANSFRRQAAEHAQDTFFYAMEDIDDLDKPSPSPQCCSL